MNTIQPTLRRTLLSSSSNNLTRSTRITPAARTFITTQRPTANIATTTLKTSLPTQQTKTKTRPFSTTTNKMGVHNIEAKSEWDSALQEKDTLMVLDCFATWCGPCKVIAPKVVEFSNSFTSAKFFKIDVDQVSDLAAELGIRAMPTFLLFKNGSKVGEVVGANPKALEAAIKGNI